jgi:hypothetical protein
MKVKNMHKGLYILVLSLMMTLSFFSLISFASDEAEAIGAPVITIRFQEGMEEQIADVRPGEHGIVTFPGFVEARIPAGSAVQDIVVDMTATTTLNWPAPVNPSQVQLSPGDQAPFSVVVSVPPETSYYVQDTLTVSGRGRAFPGTLSVQVNPVQGIIRIDQFYKFSIECDKAYQQVNPTDQLVFSIRIWNYGNGRDTFTIDLPNSNKLARDGWNIQLGTYTLEVDEKSAREITVSVNTPIKFNHWINEVEHIVIEVKSEQQEIIEGQAFPKTYPLAVRQRGFSLPGFDPILIIMSFVFITIFIGRRHHISSSAAERKLRRLATPKRTAKKL